MLNINFSRRMMLGLLVCALARPQPASGQTAASLIDAPPPLPRAGVLSPPAPENRLRDRIRTTLAYYYTRPVNSRDHNCWEVMHWIIAYGVEAELLRGGPGGRPVNAIGWLCYSGPCRDRPLISIERGRITAAKGPQVQGHYGQFLAILAQSKVMTDYSMQSGGRAFTIADLIESEKLGCDVGMELTFKLLALSHYLDSDATWLNDAGQEWSIPHLIREELQAPIRGAACGGTHRLMGLSYAVRTRQKRDEPIDGEYLRAQSYLDDYHRYTFGLQNPDGSFSTEWFARRGDRPDLDRRLQTTGHILEWMVYSLPPEMLGDRRVVQAVDYLTTILWQNRQKTWEIGPLGHGLHALALYDERVFKESESSLPQELADDETTGEPAPDDASKARRPTAKVAAKPRKSAAPAEAAPDDEPIDEESEESGEPAPDSDDGAPLLLPELRLP
ncbi:MAG: hypothetical protein WD278_01010 [Pirellulales bacterium]